VAELNYLAPTTAEEAVKALIAGGEGARVLAGGTDLLVQMRSGRLKPGTIVDVKAVAGAIGIRLEGGAFVIGAATSGMTISEHAGLGKAWPGVVEAAGLIGSTQVRGRASLAGNLCNASPAADSVPAMIAARATAIVVGPEGRREVPVEQIAIAPGKTSLRPGEFLLEFHLPVRPAHAADAYLREIPRTEMDIAIVGCGANLILNADGTCAEAHVALGAVAARALLVEAAGQALVGHKLDQEALDRLDAAARAACSPIDDKRGTIEYRTRIAGVLARRAVAIAWRRAGT
jgi:CO/xanthine dehydrogenase FAD-binding subunit